MTGYSTAYFSFHAKKDVDRKQVSFPAVNISQNVIKNCLIKRN